MTLNEALAVKARGLTKEQVIALLRRGEQPSRRHSHDRAGLEGKAVKKHPAQPHSSGCSRSASGIEIIGCQLIGHPIFAEDRDNQHCF